MKPKTAALVVSVPYIWWLIIFINQLLTKNNTCTPDDGMCNSANTFWGDFSWSLVLWAFSMIIIVPIFGLFLCVLYAIRNRELKTKHAKNRTK